MRHNTHLIPRRRRVFVFNGKGGGGDGSMTGQKFIRNWNRKENARTNGMPRHARRIFSFNHRGHSLCAWNIIFFAANKHSSNIWEYTVLQIFSNSSCMMVL